VKAIAQQLGTIEPSASSGFRQGGRNAGQLPPRGCARRLEQADPMQGAKVVPNAWQRCATAAELHGREAFASGYGLQDLALPGMKRGLRHVLPNDVGHLIARSLLQDAVTQRVSS
jgi:hypothetical protein